MQTALMQPSLVLLALLALLTPVAGQRTFYAHPSGDDHALGSFSAPLRTIQSCVDKLTGSGDRCLLKSGVYADAATVAGKRGTAAAPVVLGAAGDGAVVLDGTAPVPPARWSDSSGGGLWSATLPTSVLNGGVAQLWLDGAMQTPARWPNARSGKSAFDWTRWSNFSTSAPWPPDSYKPSKPMVFTDGAGLANSGLDATGAIAVMNIGHMDTFAAKVSAHAKGSAKFTVSLDVGAGMGNSKGNCCCCCSCSC